MPALKNPRHERFARLYHKYGVGRLAYRLAGYHAQVLTIGRWRPVDACASRLLTSASVRERLQELAGMAANAHAVTVESLVRELDAWQRMAWDEHKPAAGVQATMAKARITGMIIEKHEHGAPGEFQALNNVEDIINKARDELGEDVAEMLQAMLDGVDPTTKQDDYASANAPEPRAKRKRRQAQPAALLPPPSNNT